MRSELTFIGWWMEFCTTVIKVICLGHYYSIFYHPYYKHVPWLTPCTVHVISDYTKKSSYFIFCWPCILLWFFGHLPRANMLMDLGRNCPTPTLISAAGIWSIPGDLCLFRYSVAISNSKVWDSGTSDSAVYIYQTRSSLIVENTDPTHRIFRLVATGNFKPRSTD